MAAQEQSNRERRHPGEAELEVTGATTISEVVERATQALNAFFGEGCWDFNLIKCEPEFRTFGSSEPATWRAEVSAYEEIK